ncbi:ABC transporter substrate-binding protein [Mesorhizobium retamae]|uniref:ABC transporter substrate-binding protein n=1 Tax=Mesorhizobium retamae TaxID=2912854 RepID=A0ABS9QDA9_9HYPH|nr:ABC transporter substrate-binding protein [Mesorhizobium sp. IRAMC:0171]MCG7505403.1 ABC transporter substrate-binding protein [Mesorhizobium sp. IRAMC:0171]
MGDTKMRIGLALAATLGLWLTSGDVVHAADCGSADEISITELNWPSGAFFANLHQIVLSKGYGCNATLTPGDTASSTASMAARGKPDINPELWVDNVKDFWAKVTAEKKVYAAGHPVIEGGIEGFFIPKYVAEAHPDLKSITDLAKFKDLFPDPADPSKGVLYTCQPGWSCEVLIANMAKAFKLDSTFNLFSPGSSAALDATIVKAYQRKEPIVTYYWAPTPLLGKYPMVRLEMPPYVEGTCNNDKNCTSPKPSDFPPGKIVTAVSTAAKDKAPGPAKYLAAFTIKNQVVSQMLAWADDNKATPADTAKQFLKTHEEIWTKWVPADVAARVKAGL